IRAVGIHHDRDAHRPEKSVAYALEECLPRGDVAAADEDRGPGKLFGPAGEDRPMHKRLNRLGRDAAIAEDLVDVRIDRHHAVEHAGLRIRIELDQDALHVDARDGRRGWRIEDGRRDRGRTAPSARRTLAVSRAIKSPRASTRGLPRY